MNRVKLIAAALAALSAGIGVFNPTLAEIVHQLGASLL